MVSAPPPSGSKFESLPLVGKLLLLVLMIGVVTGIYYAAFHKGMSEELDAAQQAHAKLQSDLQEAERRQREYLAVVEELADREAVDRQNKRVLPEKAEIAAFLQDLNRLAELSGLSMQLVEPRPEEPQELYTRIPVGLSLKGRFHQLAKFFYNVSRLERAINMENISLTQPTTNDSDEVLLTVEVRATTFRRADAKAPAGPPAGQASAPGQAPAAAPGGAKR